MPPRPAPPCGASILTILAFHHAMPLQGSSNLDLNPPHMEEYSLGYISQMTVSRTERLMKMGFFQSEEDLRTFSQGYGKAL